MVAIMQFRIVCLRVSCLKALVLKYKKNFHFTLAERLLASQEGLCSAIHAIWYPMGWLFCM